MSLPRAGLTARDLGLTDDSGAEEEEALDGALNSFPQLSLLTYFIEAEETSIS